jgi:TrmH family RNA methyltransferase
VSHTPAPRLEIITSRQNAIVGRYRTAARGDQREILLDGTHLVIDAIEAGTVIHHAAIASERSGQRELRDITARLTGAGTTVAMVTAPVMAALSPVRSPSPVVAVASRPTVLDDALYAVAPSLIVLCIDVQDPGNLGAVVRVAEAAGATGVVAAGTSADPFSWKALRGAMGSALRLPVRREPETARAIAAARARGCAILAAVPRGGRGLDEIDFQRPIAILVGAEGAGLDAATAAGADFQMTVPMQPPVESLNAAVTAAIILYEARRQRHGRLAGIAGSAVPGGSVTIKDADAR